jgi:hypothetical protein
MLQSPMLDGLRSMRAHSAKMPGVVRDVPILGNTRVRKSPALETRCRFNRLRNRRRRPNLSSGPLGLKRSNSQHRAPMRVIHAPHHVTMGFAFTLRTLAWHDAPTVHKKS